MQKPENNGYLRANHKILMFKSNVVIPFIRKVYMKSELSSPPVLNSL